MIKLTIITLKRFISWIICILLYNNCLSQTNLVESNSDFEFYTTCPSNFYDLPLAFPWTNPLLFTTPDYFNACNTYPINGNSPQMSVPQNNAGYQMAHSGNGYAGIVTYNIVNNLGWDWREYIQVPLTDSLEAGETYYVSFFVSPADSAQYTTNNLGVYFSNSAISLAAWPSGPLPFQPQIENPSSNNLSDRNSWTQVTGTFIANGGEKYLLIGNFKDSSSTVFNSTGWSTNPFFNFAYLYIDDVSVTTNDSISSVSEVELPYILINDGNQIQITSNKFKIEQIGVYDCLGKSVYSDLNGNSFNFNYYHFKPGVYIIKFLIDKKIYSYRFSKN